MQPDYNARVKAGFILRGTTLGAWCRANGVWPSYAYMVLKGSTNGPTAQALRQQLLTASSAEAA